MFQKELFDFIQNLSVEDKKGLLGKTLKATEEIGELAKVILPFEDQAGTLHRFTDREQILEGAVDVILSAISIPYQLGYTHEEIGEMLFRKSRKWGDIQNVEGETKWPIPFEIHVTVKLLLNSKPDMLEMFKDTCARIGVKPIVIELEKNDEVVMQDVMTSSKHIGTNRSAYDEAMRIEGYLRSVGYKVERVKIETVPWHPMAPKTEYDDMPKDCYFESHLRIVTTNKRRSDLQAIALWYGAHLSRNFFKKLNNEEYIIMMTLRVHKKDRKSFERDVASLKESLIEDGFEVDKTEIEFAVYDSKINHDAIWLRETV